MEKVNKKLLLLLIIVLALSSSAYANMNIKAEAGPTWIYLEWTVVPGTNTYDIYLNDVCVVRLNNAETSFKAENLDSKKDYEIAIASRDKSDNTLDFAHTDATTTSWDGIYRWENKTGNDNKGKLESLQYRIETAHDDTHGQYYKIYMDKDGKEYQIFPLFNFGDQAINEWHKYKEDSLAGMAYRENASLFNTSSFTPAKWKISKIVIDSNSIEAYIQTSVIGMNLMTVTRFNLARNNDVDTITFETTSDKALVRNYLFCNPNPGEGDAFILTKVN